MEVSPAYNFPMKSSGLISLLLTAVIGVGAYLYFLKQAAPAPGMVATQAISLTGVKTDLIAIAQAERMYYVQNGSYADLATLASTGAMNITRTSRDGYTYSVEPSDSGFTVTAVHIPRRQIFRRFRSIKRCKSIRETDPPGRDPGGSRPLPATTPAGRLGRLGAFDRACIPPAMDFAHPAFWVSC